MPYPDEWRRARAVALKRLQLVHRRKALGYIQEGLAELLGCERTTIIRWERGENKPQPGADLAGRWSWQGDHMKSRAQRQPEALR